MRFKRLPAAEQMKNWKRVGQEPAVSRALLVPYKPKVAAVIPADFPITRVDAAESPSSVGMTAVRMHVKRGSK